MTFLTTESKTGMPASSRQRGKQDACIPIKILSSNNPAFSESVNYF